MEKIGLRRGFTSESPDRTLQSGFFYGNESPVYRQCHVFEKSINIRDEVCHCFYQSIEIQGGRNVSIVSKNW